MLNFFKKIFNKINGSILSKQIIRDLKKEDPFIYK
jgi:hypothetical protein